MSKGACSAPVAAPVSAPVAAPVAVPTAPGRRSITLADLQAFMGRPGGNDLSGWVSALNTAAARYDLNTDKRWIGFLSQIRHETAAMTIFYQKIDNGAGVVHMVPSNWPDICADVPEVKAEFAARYAGCSECSCVGAMKADPMGARSTDAALNIFNKPLIGALSGGWWFDKGAYKAFSWKGCTQPLKVYADQGIGAMGSGDCTHTGDYQLTCCIFWTVGSGSGLDQRLAYYREAQNYASSAWGYRAAESEELTEYRMNPGVNAGIAIGCVVGIVALIVVIVALYIKRKHRLQSEVV
jgi:hypothetical protein